VLIRFMWKLLSDTRVITLFPGCKRNSLATSMSWTVTFAARISTQNCESSCVVL